MSESLLIAIVGALGSAGGIFTLIKALLDHRANAASRVEDADERMLSRLERRLDTAETQIASLREQHDKDNAYIMILITKIASCGGEVPDRP